MIRLQYPKPKQNPTRWLHPFCVGMLSMLSMLVCLSWTTTVQATSVIQLTEEQMVEMSTLIVRGKVAAQRSIWGPNNMGIVTLVTIVVEEEMVGRQAPKQVIVRHFGGTIGKDTVKIMGFPAFTVGSEVIVFVQSSPYLPKEEYLLIGLSQGKYEVSRPDDQAAATDLQSKQPLVVRSVEGLKLFKAAPNQPLQPMEHDHKASTQTQSLQAFSLRLRNHWKNIQSRREQNLLVLPKPTLPKVHIPQVPQVRVKPIEPVKPRTPAPAPQTPQQKP